MTKQTLLFGNSEPLVQPVKALARSSDPDSSKEAAAKMVSSGEAKRQRERCVDLVWSRPGCTSFELAVASADMDRYQFGRRLPEAEKLGQVKKGAIRKCKVSGNRACTWWPGGNA